jgi:hypothetical protein
MAKMSVTRFEDPACAPVLLLLIVMLAGMLLWPAVIVAGKSGVTPPCTAACAGAAKTDKSAAVATATSESSLRPV